MSVGLTAARRLPQYVRWENNKRARARKMWKEYIEWDRMKYKAFVNQDLA